MPNFLKSETGIFLKAATGSAAANILALLISMAGSVMLTRALGVEGRGVMSWIASLLTIAAAILQFGMGQASRRFVAEDIARAGDMAVAIILAAIAGSAIILPVFILYGFSEQIAAQYQALVVIGMFAAPVMAIGLNLSEMLVALRKYRLYNAYLLTQKTANCLLVVLLVSLGIVNPTYAVCALLASYVAQTCLVIYGIRHKIKNRLRDYAWVLNKAKSYITASYIAQLLQVVSGSAMAVLVAAIAGAKEAGLFAACMILADAARTSLNMVSMHTLPHIIKAKDAHERQKYIRHSLYITLLFSAIAAVILYATSGFVLVLLFGDEFGNGANLLKILSIALVFIAMHNTLLTIIASQYEGWKLAVSSVVLAAMVFVNSVLFIPQYGAMGGAIAYLGASLAACIAAGVIMVCGRKIK
jgi:O-antigen/teichoic acid export membrane protein